MEDIEEKTRQQIVEGTKIKANLVDYDLEYNYVLDFDATCSEIERIMEFDKKSMKQVYTIVSDFFLRHYHFKTIALEESSVCYVYNGGIYVQEAYTLVDRETRRMLKEAYSGNSSNAVLAHIKAQTYIREEDFIVKNPLLLPVQNGILNVQTRELMNYSHDYYFFKKLPVTYNPEAQCWTIGEFFDQVLPDINDVFLLQQIFGYCLFRDYNIHKFFVFSGYGRNGKGVTLNILAKLLGSQNTTHHSLFKLSDGGFMASELFRKMANINADLPEGIIKDTGMLKQLCGGDRITANRKFMTGISFKNYAKLIFSTNGMPQFHDTSEGWKKRWILIEFKEQFFSETEIKELEDEEQKGINIANPNLFDEITTEENMSGLLNWALDGLQTLFEDGAFTPSKSSAEAWRIIRMKGDPYSIFCEETLEEDSFKYVAKSALRVIYAKWCIKNGLPTKLVNKKLKDALENLPFPVWEEQRVEVNGERCWVGIKINEIKEKEKPNTPNTPKAPFLS